MRKQHNQAGARLKRAITNETGLHTAMKANRTLTSPALSQGLRYACSISLDGQVHLGVQYPLTSAFADVTSSGGGAGDEEQLISMRTIGRSESNQRGRTVPPALLIHK
jgi:hypothetical protein